MEKTKKRKLGPDAVRALLKQAQLEPNIHQRQLAPPSERMYRDKKTQWEE